MADLNAYLEEASSRRFQWGIHDCCLFGADWAIRLCGQDPAAAYRGRYSTRIGAALEVGRRGGLMAAVRGGLEGVGAVAVDDYQPGDIGLVSALTDEGFVSPMVAICTGRKWSFLIPHGMAGATLAPLAAWRL